MNRYLVFFFLTAICMAGLPTPPALPADDAEKDVLIDTPEEAAEFASKLANEKCQSAFGAAPFTPDSYSPQLIGSRWQWGKIECPGIRGYSAEVQFNTDGSDPKTRAVLHTDKLFDLQTIYPEDSLFENGLNNPEYKQLLDKEGNNIYIQGEPAVPEE